MTSSTSNLLVLAAGTEKGVGLDAGHAVWQALRGLDWCQRVEFQQSAVPLAHAACEKEASAVVLVQTHATGRAPGTVLVTWPKHGEHGQTVVVIEVEPDAKGHETAQSEAVRQGTALAVRTAATVMGQLCRGCNCPAQGPGGPLACPRITGLPASLHRA